MLAAGHSESDYGPFNALGQMLNSSQSTANTLYSFSYGHNLADALTLETYPSGRTVATGYDSANRVTTVGGTLNGVGTPYVSSVTYAAHGAPAFYNYGNGVSRAFSYNTRLQLQESTDRVTGQPNWALDLQYRWGDNGTQTLNNNGNLRGELIQTWNGPNFSAANNYWEQFTYDGVNRVRSMQDNGGGNNERDFAYDQYGNMWVSGNAGFAAPGSLPTANIYNGNNRFNNTSYDAAGNQLSISGDAVAYDAEGQTAQLTESASLGGATMTYVYDGEGRRVEKLVNSAAATVYVYDAQGRLAAEYAASATPAALCQTCYLSTDHLGSTRMVTDQSGNVVARHDYLPFGEEIVGTAARTSLWGASDNVNQKFTGKERDQESGLDYFGARYYGSALGRFTSPDWSDKPQPVPYADFSDPQTLNLYSYIRNNPLAKNDPDGHCCWDYFVGFAKGTANRLLDNASELAKNGDPIQQVVNGAVQTDFRFTASGADQQSGMQAGYSNGETVVGIAMAVVGPKGESTKTLPNEAPGFVVSPGGDVVPVPEGARGPNPVLNEQGETTGFSYTGGRGGKGLDPRVTDVRVMDPTAPRGNSPGYPNGYVTYQNKARQGVNPQTGKTVSRPDSSRHIRLSGCNNGGTPCP